MGLAVGTQVGQSVTDLDEGAQHSVLIARQSYAGFGLGGALACLQDAAVEDRRGQAREQVPAATAVAEQALRRGCGLGEGGGELDVGIPAGLGDADGGGSGMQFGFSRQDVRPLA